MELALPGHRVRPPHGGKARSDSGGASIPSDDRRDAQYGVLAIQHLCVHPAKARVGRGPHAQRHRELPPSLVAGNLCVAHAGHLARQAGLDQFVLGAKLRQDDVRLAQRIEQALATRPVVPASDGFANAVVARVRQERWRSEQLLDWSFNAFVGIGVALVLFGVVGLIFASGAVVISRDLSAAYGVVAQNAARIVSAQAPTVAIGMLMLTLMLSVWWWVEHEDAAI